MPTSGPAAWPRRLVRAVEITIGGVLIASAAMKGYELSLFMIQIAGYRLVPPGLEGAVAAAIVVAEAALGALLIAGVGRGLPHALTIGLLAGFSGVFIYGMTKHGIEECGCFGDFLKLPPWVTLTKNAVMVMLLVAALAWRWLARKQALPLSRRLAAAALVMALFSIGALGVGARIQVTEERAKQAMAAGPVDATRPYARFKFQADGREFDLAGGQYLVVWLSTTCRECEEAVAPLAELMQAIPDMPPVVGLCLGNGSSLEDFRAETKPPFPLVLAPSRLFMEYVQVDPPLYVLIRDGQPVAEWESQPPALDLAQKISGL